MPPFGRASAGGLIFTSRALWLLAQFSGPWAWCFEDSQRTTGSVDYKLRIDIRSRK
jgi:hypothetical protein